MPKIVGLVLVMTLLALTAPMGEPVLAAGAEVSYAGGDVVTLRRPRVVRAPATLGSAWKTVSAVGAAGLPEAGAGSALVRVTVTGARRAGAVVGRPSGATASGTRILSFTRSRTEGLALLPVGVNGEIQLRTTAGNPRVSVAVVSWIPKMASLIVPPTPAPGADVTVGTTRRTVRLTADGPPAEELRSALVAVRTTARKSGRLAVWTPGAPSPSTGDSFAAGSQTLLKVVRLSPTGGVALRAFGASARVQVDVLAWGLATTTLEATRAPMALGAVKGGTARKVTVAGAKGIPAGAQDVFVTISAPKGMTVKVWPTAAGKGAPSAFFTSSGGATTVALQVPKARSVLVKAAGVAGAARVVATGWVSRLGKQQVTFQPRAGTSLIGPSDVVSMTDNTAVIRPTAGVIAADEHVMLRPADAPAAYVGRVVEAAPVSGGNTRLVLTNASLAEAFVDYKATFSGPLTHPVSSGPPASSEYAAAGMSLTPDWLKLSFFGGDHWQCDSGGLTLNDPVDVDIAWGGDINAGVDVADRMLDISLKGSLQTTIKMNLPTGISSVSCSVSGQFPGQLPLGSTGLSAKFGGTGSLEFSKPDDDSAAITMVGTSRVYAAFFYSRGTVVKDATLGFDADVHPNANRGEAVARLGVGVGIGPAEIPGFDESRWWEGSLILGYKFRIGPPDPGEDPHRRVMLGPRCLDASVGPYMEVGAALMEPFFPDVSISQEPVQLDQKPLYRGPCWGYSGTITYESVGKMEKGQGGCTAQSCPEAEWDLKWTKTLVPQAASFTRFDHAWYGAFGTPVLQPYTWTYSKVETIKDDVPMTYDGSHSSPCTWLHTATGTGAQDWPAPDDPDRSKYETFIFEGWEPGSYASASSGVPGAQVQQMTTPSGDPKWCGEEQINEVPVEDRTSTTDVVDLASYGKRQINVTLSGHPEYHPEWGWTATLNLTRDEYPR